MAELHTALRSEELDSQTAGGLEMKLVKVQHGKHSSALGLHVNPTSYGLSGLQSTDLLSFLGFRHKQCAFMRGQCYSREVPESLSLAGFAGAFERYSELMREAARKLSSCGYIFPQPEGWGYFTGRRNSGRRGRRSQAQGDGHRVDSHERMKESEDQYYEYVFTWVKSPRDKGWVTHYRPKDDAAKAMMRRFRSFFPEVADFRECPEFDFESCFWRFEAFEESGPLGSNANFAHGHFDAHDREFGPALVSLLAADAVAQELVVARIDRSDLQATKGPSRQRGARSKDETRDVFLCHAGEDKPLVLRPLCASLDDAGISYWFDEAEIEWGQSVTGQVNRGFAVSKFVIVVLSGHFVGKPWPERELNAALSIESASGKVKVLPLIVGGKETEQRILEAYPLLNDKAYIRWEGNGGNVAAALERLLNS